MVSLNILVARLRNLTPIAAIYNVTNAVKLRRAF